MTHARLENAPQPTSVALVPAAGPVAGPAPLDRERYTVLLLDEDQLERFLARPRVRDVAPLSARALRAWPRAPRLTLRRAAMSVAVVAAAATVWIRASGDHLEAPIAAAAPVVSAAPPVPTGASFTVRVARFAGGGETRTVANRLVKSGLPAFAWQVDGSLPDLLVGPFVSIDEAERAQRAMAVKGYRRSRLHVDERLRSTVMAQPSATPAVLVVAAPGREALVFELAGEPRAVSGERVDARTFDVLTSPTGAPIDAQTWSAPDDVRLIHRVAVEGDATGERGLTARVTLAPGALAGVRVEGSRVYVDVQEAASAMDTRSAPLRARRATGGLGIVPAPVPSVPASPDDIVRYREAIAPVFARFEEIQPFLRSAVGQGSPDVLAAVGGTFGELEQTLRSVSVPRGAAEVHSLLTSAVQLATGALTLGSAADRAVQVREATAQFQAARARLR